MKTVKRNILLNPGPATTTDSVKWAQVVPDICPREREFAGLMKGLREDLLRIVHAPSGEYVSVLFCGSGTIGIDICLNSLSGAGKKVLIIRNGTYSARAQEICEAYGLPHRVMELPYDAPPSIDALERMLAEEAGEVGLVYCTHNETGTGLLNPIREIGAAAHRYGALSVVDTTSTLAMRPIDVVSDHIDFCMASAQKGLTAMAGLSFIIGRRSVIEQSRSYPVRSYYCNLYMQYAYFEETGEMHFTPPVQTIYAALQAVKEYFAEGEQAKWARHTRVYEALHRGLDELGFRDIVPPGCRAGLVVCVRYPDDPRWDFDKVHDFCRARGYTIYPGKIGGPGTFRLCALGAIDETDITGFFRVFREALSRLGVSLPVHYNSSSAEP